MGITSEQLPFYPAFFFLCFFTAINPMLLKLYFKALICKRTRTNTKIVSCKPLYCKLTKYRGEQEKTINDFVACTWKYPISGGVLIKDGSFLSWQTITKQAKRRKLTMEKQIKYTKKPDTFNLIQFSVHQKVGKRGSLSSYTVCS